MASSSLPSLPFGICDAHHHLWDLERVHYPWLAAKGVKRFFGDPTPIQCNYFPADLQADAGTLCLEKSVHIQVGAAIDQSLNETAFAQDMADTTGLPTAIVAYCDLEQDNRTELLDSHQQYSALRGIRQIIGRAPGEDLKNGSGALLHNPKWLQGLEELMRRGLRFDLQLIPDQMETAFHILSQVEDLPVALCHAGSPWYRDAEGWEMWRSGLEKLASLPRLVCKISGLGMFDHNWTVDSLTPVVETVLEIFGTRRCMFGSNFPVDKLYRDYSAYWNSYNEITAGCSADERHNLFRGCCEQFYDI